MISGSRPAGRSVGAHGRASWVVTGPIGAGRSVVTNAPGYIGGGGGGLVTAAAASPIVVSPETTTLEGPCPEWTTVAEEGRGCQPSGGDGAPSDCVPSFRGASTAASDACAIAVKMERVLLNAMNAAVRCLQGLETLPEARLRQAAVEARRQIDNALRFHASKFACSSCPLSLWRTVPECPDTLPSAPLQQHSPGEVSTSSAAAKGASSGSPSQTVAVASPDVASSSSPSLTVAMVPVRAASLTLPAQMVLEAPVKPATPSSPSLMVEVAPLRAASSWSPPHTVAVARVKAVSSMSPSLTVGLSPVWSDSSRSPEQLLAKVPPILPRTTVERPRIARASVPVTLPTAAVERGRTEAAYAPVPKELLGLTISSNLTSLPATPNECWASPSPWSHSLASFPSLDHLLLDLQEGVDGSGAAEDQPRWLTPSVEGVAAAAGHPPPPTTASTSPAFGPESPAYVRPPGLKSRLLATGTDDFRLTVWNADTGAVVYEVSHSGFLSSVAWSPTGDMIATGSDDGMVRIIDASSGKVLLEAAYEQPTRSVSWAPSGEFLAIAYGKELVILDAKTGETKRQMRHQYFLWAVAWSTGSGDRIATGGEDKSFRIFQFQTEELVVDVVHGGIVLAISWCPSGHLVATGCTDGAVRTIDALSGQIVLVVQHGIAVHTVAWSPCGEKLASGSGKCRIIDATTGIVHLQVDHEGVVSALAWDADGQRLVTCSDYGILRIIDVVGRRIEREETHGAYVRAIAWAP